MTDHPIIFSGPMVRALLDGHKTMTRRLAWRHGGSWPGGHPHFGASPWQKVMPGDRLWVRESAMIVGYHCDKGPVSLAYRADDDHVLGVPFPDRLKFRPEMRKMLPNGTYREASRLTLEVTAIKIEKLQAITRDDAIAEGATSKPALCGYRGMDAGWSMNWKTPHRDHALNGPREAFGAFINELYGGMNWNIKPTNLWAENPDVVAISFKVHKRNIDRS